MAQCTKFQGQMPRTAPIAQHTPTPSATPLTAPAGQPPQGIATPLGSTRSDVVEARATALAYDADEMTPTVKKLLTTVEGEVPVSARSVKRDDRDGSAQSVYLAPHNGHPASVVKMIVKDPYLVAGVFTALDAAHPTTRHVLIHASGKRLEDIGPVDIPDAGENLPTVQGFLFNTLQAAMEQLTKRLRGQPDKDQFVVVMPNSDSVSDYVFVITGFTPTTKRGKRIAQYFLRSPGTGTEITIFASSDLVGDRNACVLAGCAYVVRGRSKFGIRFSIENGDMDLAFLRMQLPEASVARVPMLPSYHFFIGLVRASSSVPDRQRQDDAKYGYYAESLLHHVGLELYSFVPMPIGGLVISFTETSTDSRSAPVLLTSELWSQYVEMVCDNDVKSTTFNTDLARSMYDEASDLASIKGNAYPQDEAELDARARGSISRIIAQHEGGIRRSSAPAAAFPDAPSHADDAEDPDISDEELTPGTIAMLPPAGVPSIVDQVSTDERRKVTFNHIRFGAFFLTGEDPTAFENVDAQLNRMQKIINIKVLRTKGLQSTAPGTAIHVVFATAGRQSGSCTTYIFSGAHWVAAATPALRFSNSNEVAVFLKFVTTNRHFQGTFPTTTAP